jgi:hypothetical protein
MTSNNRRLILPSRIRVKKEYVLVGWRDLHFLGFASG